MFLVDEWDRSERSRVDDVWIILRSLGRSIRIFFIRGGFWFVLERSI